MLKSAPGTRRVRVGDFEKPMGVLMKIDIQPVPGRQGASTWGTDIPMEDF